MYGKLKTWKERMKTNTMVKAKTIILRYMLNSKYTDAESQQFHQLSDSDDDVVFFEVRGAINRCVVYLT